jgi:hypothetical protein
LTEVFYVIAGIMLAANFVVFLLPRPEKDTLL